MKKFLVETSVERVTDDGQPCWVAKINSQPLQYLLWTEQLGEIRGVLEFSDQPEAEQAARDLLVAHGVRLDQIDFRSSCWVGSAMPENFEDEARAHEARMRGDV